MKNLIFITALVLFACSKPGFNNDESIKKVETSLLSEVYIAGDTLWTIEERMKHYGVPGVSIAVIVENKIAWTKTWGIMDKETNEPVTATTLFQAGSISKPVAAYGALKEVELGKLTLDDNINNYLTSWKLPDNEFTKDKKVALKHLLSHTGGTTVHGFPGYTPGTAVPTLVQVLDGAAPANTPAIRVDKAPEESFRYSGGGYCVMQQTLIDLEHKSFPEILHERVLQPLGMSNSTYNQPLDSIQIKHAATGYLPDHSQTSGKRHTYPEMAAAGLWTTAEDLAKFAIDVQNTYKGTSHTVLSQDMAKKMLTPFVADFIGLGIFLEDFDGEIYFGHGGWDEGFSSQMIAHRDKGYGVVVLTNSNHPAFIEELIRSVAHTYKWDKYIPEYKALPMDPAKFPSIVGRYRNGSDGMITVYSEGKRLFRKYIRGVPQEMFRISDDTYISRTSADEISFKTNPADGKLHIILKKPLGKETFEHAKLTDDENIPYEFLLAGEFDKALKAYQAMKATDPNDGAINEGTLNGQGYDRLREEKFELAKNIFKLNMALYPTSANTYDSYAEACMVNGDTVQAILNYKKSLALNPKNDNAVRMLEAMAKK